MNTEIELKTLSKNIKKSISVFKDGDVVESNLSLRKAALLTNIPFGVLGKYLRGKTSGKGTPAFTEYTFVLTKVEESI